MMNRGKWQQSSGRALSRTSALLSLSSLGVLSALTGCTDKTGGMDGFETRELEALSGPVVNVPGITGSAAPPDTIGEVGLNHYVQAVNSTQFGIWDKSGSLVGGPVSLASLWTAGPCASDFADPTVNYDQLADRWVLTQIASDGGGFCLAVSQTATPGTTAADYHLYEIHTPNLPDYQKLGIWPDAYYVTSYEYPDLGLYALDRAALLDGSAPSVITCAVSGSECLRDTLPALGAVDVRDTRVLPVDLEGPTPPAVGAPGIFVRPVDGQQDTTDPTDRLEVYTASVDWTAQTWAVAGPTVLAPNPFDIMLCDTSTLDVRDCIPQPGGSEIDALSNRPMMALRYRQFAGHGTLVFNQTVNVQSQHAVATNEVAGVRWYELRDDGTGWTIFDQGDYTPQDAPADESELIHRWMGSMAQDRDGNMALGYSFVNSDSDAGEEQFPGIAYTGRYPTDLPGTMGPEIIVAQSANASTLPARRWGDYSAMSVDPADDCTFWYTTHLADGDTRIVSFKFDECGCNAETYEAEAMTKSAGNAAPPDGWNLHSNGFISTTHDFTAGPAAVTVRALGQLAQGVAPHMIVRVGGAVIGNVYVTNTAYADFEFTFNAPGGTQEIRIEFDNDFYQPPQDRNLWLDRVIIGCTSAPTTNPCDGLCDTPQSFSWGDDYQSGNLGTGAICRETTQLAADGNCGNFAPGRQLLVNGTPMVCNGAGWGSAMPAPRNGGYCVETTPGNWPWAFYTLW